MMGIQPMEIRPPCAKKEQGQVREHCNEASTATYDVVVLAADRSSRATTLSKTDDGNGRAIETDERVQG